MKNRLSTERVRLLFSNEWGEGPVHFESVRLARSVRANEIDPATDVGGSFGGSPCVTIPTGETRYSDPLDFEVSALSSVAVSIHFGAVPANVTGHPGSRTTSYIGRGDEASTDRLPAAAATEHWYYVTGIDVEAAEPSAAIVTPGRFDHGRTRVDDQRQQSLARQPRPPPEGQPAHRGALGAQSGHRWQRRARWRPGADRPCPLRARRDRAARRALGDLPAYDSGDQLHLSVAGYQAMADAIDLALFQP